MGNQSDNLVEGLFTRAKERGWLERPAICQGDETLDYGSLIERVGRQAGVLKKEGVGPGDRVAIYSPDCQEAAIAVLAVLYAGGIALPVSELSAANDLRDRLNDAEASVAIVHHELQQVFSEIRGEVPSLTVALDLMQSADSLASREAKTKPVQAVGRAASDGAILLYSAGASNEAGQGLRGVLHPHKTPVHAFASFGEKFLGFREDDRVFSTVRIATAYGLGTGLLFPLMAGACTLFMPEQAHSTTVVDAVKSFRPTIFAATPSLYGQLARDQSESTGDLLTDVRWCLAGAENMPPKVIAMAKAMLGTNVTVGYGLTEAFQFVIAGIAAGTRPGNCGTLLDGVEARIVNDEGEPVGIDEIGTLELRSKTLISSYWRGDLDLGGDDWFTTRDRFMVDSEANYYHCGRIDQLFKVGGKWVAPVEVEALLLAHEAVWECALIGAEDEDGLVKPMAFVVPNIGHEGDADLEQELRSYVKQELAPYKYPRWIEFVDELPKGPAGVILRYKLRDRVLQTRSRRRAETLTGK